MQYSRIQTGTLLIVALATLSLLGCTPGRSSAYSQQRTVTLAEWDSWAEDISNRVTQSPNFNRYGSPDSPVTLAIGDFVNSSTRMDVGQDKDVFLNALQRKLVNTGKATVTRLYSGSGGRTDSVTRLSGELTQDTQFRDGSTDGMDNQAEAARLVLSVQFNQKRSVADSGRNVFENYFHIELIDQKSKSVIYSDDVFRNK